VCEEILDLPLFPLNTVLFPGMELPLHIFEDRYRLMISECLERNQDFGVLMARADAGGEGTATAYTVGTSARITHVHRLQDGRMDILTSGLERYRVLHVLCTEPYIIGRIEAFPLEGTSSPQVSELVWKASALFVRYLRLTGEVLGTRIDIESTPRDATGLAYLVAITLEVSLEEKQELLSIRTLPALLARESLILSREEILLNRMRKAQEDNTGYVRGETQYLSLN
jgi:Lon protease-like protein